jgi:flavin-dependent dehydrogenase
LIVYKSKEIFILRVAIIGGGLAGIICALQLERLGITPCIFERNNDLAEPYRHAGMALEIALRPIDDPLQYLEHKYNIAFNPSGLVKKVIHISPKACTTIKGNLGYFLYRGSEPNSIDNQLAKKLKCKIFLNKEVDFKKIKNDYDYVVVASGLPDEAKQLGIWQDIIKMGVKGAVVLGNFKTDRFIVWINKDYCKSGYAYLVPFNNKEASLILAVDGIELNEIDRYWEMFINTEKINYKVIEPFKRMHYSGFVYPHRIDNIYFIGNAAGVLDPLLGFGVFPTVVTASEAAKSIAFKTDYESGIKSIVELNKKFLEFRKAFSLLDNRLYNLLIRSLGLPGVNTLVYKTKINVLTIGYHTLKPINSMVYFGKKFIH